MKSGDDSGGCSDMTAWFKGSNAIPSARSHVKLHHQENSGQSYNKNPRGRVPAGIYNNG